MTETTQETIAQFIARVGLTMTAESAKSNPNADSDTWSKGASHWLCVIDRDGHKMPVPFSQGAAHRRWKKHHDTWVVRNGHGATDKDFARLGYKPGGSILGVRPSLSVDKWILEEATEPSPPDLASVLDCLASDSSSYDNARDFEDWCADFGMDTDSRKAERTYRVCGEQAKALRHLLGKEYDALMACERL